MPDCLLAGLFSLETGEMRKELLLLPQCLFTFCSSIHTKYIIWDTVYTSFIFNPSSRKLLAIAIG